MSIKDNYPSQSPAVLLDFRNAKSVDPRLACTRASTATYFDELGVLRTAASGEPRITFDPATGACEGLLREGQATNLFTYSEDFSDASWVKVAATVGSNVIVAPDGLLVGDFIQEDLTASTHRVAKTFTPPSSSFTLSAYFKYKDAPFVYIGYFTYGCSFNVETGSIGTLTANATGAQIIPVGNGWYS